MKFVTKPQWDGVYRAEVELREVGHSVEVWVAGHKVAQFTDTTMYTNLGGVARAGLLHTVVGL